ncbi:MAG TPA: hypothetical protein GX706_02415 [Candidatus Moranbacteria bacterium]|nr:hypothetical protein [Candidatus Moranbacteria bacterium]
MNTSTQQELIQQITEEFLAKMGMSGKVVITQSIAGDNENNSEKYTIAIESDESKFLIGKLGNNLAALQHILRILINKKISSTEKINFTIDVNNYKSDQKKSLLHLARELAAQATAEGKTILMEPMNSFERRLVHLELESFRGIKTESIGEGKERKIAIKPESISEELGFNE